MSAITKGIYIVGAKRTALGAFGGSLKNLTACELQIIAANAALKAAGVAGSQVDSVIIGNVYAFSSTDGFLTPRHVGLHCGIPIEKTATYVNRLCGSGFQSIITAAHDILISNDKISLAGGVESMSTVPFLIRNIRFGTNFTKKYILEDALWESFYDSYCKLTMAQTAEILAEKYKISRQRADEFSLLSHKNWQKGLNEGAFKEEIAPIQLKVKGKEVEFAVDENPRPSSTIESLAKLPSLVGKDGTVTAATSCGISDGAAAIVLASEAAVKEYNLKPLARLAAYSYVGVQPEIMGFGPVPAIQNVLKVSDKTLDDIDLIEINEAFAPQTLACIDGLQVDPAKVNINGGAIAMGHPLGCSGTRISTHLVHEMKRKNVKYSIGSACLGGGQGIAVLFESC